MPQVYIDKPTLITPVMGRIFVNILPEKLATLAFYA